MTHSLTPPSDNSLVPSQVLLASSRRYHQTTIPHIHTLFQSTDNTFIGDAIPPKSDSTFRLFYNNVNGLSHYDKYRTLHKTLDHLQSLQPDLLSFTEPNLAFEQTATRFDVLKVIKRHLPSSRLICSSSAIPSLSPYKPGGSMMISTKSINCRITKQFTDPLGRWTYVSFSKKQSSFVTFITVYKPCRTSIDHIGPMTVYRQQWLALRQQGQLNPSP